MRATVKFEPGGQQIQVRCGTTVLDASRRARAHVRTRCGGKASCLMCKVTVADQSGLTPPGRIEEMKLGPGLGRGVRLACQAIVRGDVTVRVPEDPLKAIVRRQLAEQANAREKKEM